jgi:hypothetical protein
MSSHVVPALSSAARIRSASSAGRFLVSAQDLEDVQSCLGDWIIY